MEKTKLTLQDVQRNAALRKMSHIEYTTDEETKRTTGAIVEPTEAKLLSEAKELKLDIKKDANMDAILDVFIENGILTGEIQLKKK